MVVRLMGHSIRRIVSESKNLEINMRIAQKGGEVQTGVVSCGGHRGGGDGMLLQSIAVWERSA